MYEKAKKLPSQDKKRYFTQGYFTQGYFTQGYFTQCHAGGDSRHVWRSVVIASVAA